MLETTSGGCHLPAARCVGESVMIHHQQDDCLSFAPHVLDAIQVKLKSSCSPTWGVAHSEDDEGSRLIENDNIDRTSSFKMTTSGNTPASSPRSKRDFLAIKSRVCRTRLFTPTPRQQRNYLIAGSIAVGLRLRIEGIVILVWFKGNDCFIISQY
jgi:hypothetical protein